LFVLYSGELFVAGDGKNFVFIHDPRMGLFKAIVSVIILIVVILLERHWSDDTTGGDNGDRERRVSSGITIRDGLLLLLIGIVITAYKHLMTAVILHLPPSLSLSLCSVSLFPFSSRHAAMELGSWFNRGQPYWSVWWALGKQCQWLYDILSQSINLFANIQNRDTGTLITAYVKCAMLMDTKEKCPLTGTCCVEKHIHARLSIVWCSPLGCRRFVEFREMRNKMQVRS